EDEGCTNLSGFSYMELKVGYISSIKVGGGNPRLGTSCDIFTNSRGKRASKGSKTCGFVDERGLYKSLKGACKLKLCGVLGLRLMDGTWVAMQTSDETKWCPPDQLVNLHDGGWSHPQFEK
uniref:Glycoprotein,Glycoprotein n=1 Tax=Rabies virus TaxID=11292 RepID=UPI001395C9B2|nr:Chain G, Glycoprotein,Glycoprotein [Lyssavirus rabies]